MASMTAPEAGREKVEEMERVRYEVCAYKECRLSTFEEVLAEEEELALITGSLGSRCVRDRGRRVHPPLTTFLGRDTCRDATEESGC